MLLQTILTNTTRRFPDKIALKFEQRVLSYLEIDNISTHFARKLQKLDVKIGDRVVIFLENCPEAVLYLYAVLKADAVFVIIHPQTKLDKLIYIVNDCDAKILISSSNILNQLKQKVSLKKSCPSLASIILIDDKNERLNKNQLKAPNSVKYKNIDLNLAGLIYTSGSTGFPKGVMMTHLNIITAVRSIIDYLNNQKDDVVFNALPLSFDYGLYQVFMTFYFGGTLILEKDFDYVQIILKIIQEEKVTCLPLVPTMISLLFGAKNLQNFNFSHLRYISSTGSQLPLWQIEKIRMTWPNIKIFSMYGLTECKRVSFLAPDEIDKRPMSVGKAIPNLEIFIVNEQGEQLEIEQVGELVVRGTSVMKGYWNDPKGTSDRIRTSHISSGLLLYTGDLFRMDSDGFLYFEGRKDEMLKVKGERIYPKEIENVISQMMNIQEVAVIGIKDNLWGAILKAFIKLKDNNSPPNKQNVMHYCRHKLEAFSIPRDIVFVESFPRTSTGKVDKKMLK